MVGRVPATGESPGNHPPFPTRRTERFQCGDRATGSTQEHTQAAGESQQAGQDRGSGAVSPTVFRRRTTTTDRPSAATSSALVRNTTYRSAPGGVFLPVAGRMQSRRVPVRRHAGAWRAVSVPSPCRRNLERSEGREPGRWSLCLWRGSNIGIPHVCSAPGARQGGPPACSGLQRSGR